MQKEKKINKDITLENDEVKLFICTCHDCLLKNQDEPIK